MDRQKSAPLPLEAPDPLPQAGASPNAAVTATMDRGIHRAAPKLIEHRACTRDNGEGPGEIAVDVVPAGPVPMNVLALDARSGSLRYGLSIAALFGLTIFLSAFLLFQVQLIIAKNLLPWFGGAPTVWTTCQLFFQILLLAGYGYAHVLACRRDLRRQGQIHLALLLAAIAALGLGAAWGGLPLLAPEVMKPNGTERPVALLLLTLVMTVGLPFFVLSATGPLVQRWHSH